MLQLNRKRLNAVRVSKPRPAVVACLLVAVPVAAMGQATVNRAQTPARHSPDLYLSRFFGSDVQRFYGPQSATPMADHPAPGLSGATYSRSGVARRPWGIAFGPDGNLFVANQQGGDGAVMRIKGPFASDAGEPAPAPGQSGDVFVPNGNFFTVAFGLDQNLYAGGYGPVQRFDAATGAAMGDFTTGRALAVVEGIAFGPDQDLYVANFNGCVPSPTCGSTVGEILRFDGKTGNFLNTFVANGTGGLQHPGGIGFGTDGDIFVCNEFVNGSSTGSVLRFHGPLNSAAGQAYPATGEQGAVFATTAGISPGQLAFGPDRTLYVTHSGGVIAYNGRTGVFERHFASATEARGIAFYNGDK